MSITKIETMEQLAALLERSREAPVWILKHSLICPVSDAAWAEYRRFAAAGAAADAEFALVEIQNARPVSAAIEERTSIRHESPQALLLEGGQAVWNASHWGITADALARAQESVVERQAPA